MSENNFKITPEFIINLVLRRRWFILVPFSLVIVAGIFYAMTTPRKFEAKTLILVEGQRVPQNFVQSIVTEDTSERINTIKQQILSRTNLEKIVQDLKLFSGPEYAQMFIEDKVNGLRQNISVDVHHNRMTRTTDAFEIYFKGKDPEKVMQVVNGLAAAFIDENLKVRESQALGTSTFLESELENIRIKLEQFEENIKNYRKANMGELPEQLETNLRILERLQVNLSDRQQSLREAKIRLAALKNQASTQQPSVVVIGTGQGAQEGAATLEELNAELESLQSRYTDRHPDIIRLKKQIKEMKQRNSENNGDNQNLLARIPPELRTEISEVQREIEGSDIEISNLENQIAAYQQRIENTPKREQELLSLKRDYENIQTSYESLLNRKLEADIGVNMERQQKGEQFRIVDPASIPQRPVEPNMMRVFLGTVVFGLGLGGGIAFLIEYFDTSFSKPDDLESTLELPVLTTIPDILSRKQLVLRKLNIIGSYSYAFLNLCLLGLFGIISL